VFKSKSSAKDAVSNHLSDEFVDLLLSVSVGSVVLIWVSFQFNALSGRVKLEGPEEVVGFLEVRAAGGDFVDQVFNADNSVLSELTLDDAVVGKGDSGSVDLSEPSLVNEVGDGLGGGVAVSNEGFHPSDHVDGGSVQSDEHTVVQLSQSQELHDLSALGGELVDTIEQVKS
jgi:hypothetical protein